MKYCPYCGTELPNDVRFCTRCGADVSSIQMPSQQSIPQPYIPTQQYPPQPPAQPAYTPPPRPQQPHIPPPKKHSKTGGIVAVFLVVAIIIAGIVIISAQQSSYITHSPQPNILPIILAHADDEVYCTFHLHSDTSRNFNVYVDDEYLGVWGAPLTVGADVPTGQHTLKFYDYGTNELIYSYVYDTSTGNEFDVYL